MHPKECGAIPVGQKRHLDDVDVVGQNLPQDNFCLKCLAITFTVGVILKEEKSPLLWARASLGKSQFGRHLGDNSGEGNCKSKLSQDSGETIFSARHQDVSQGPLPEKLEKAGTVDFKNTPQTRSGSVPSRFAFPSAQILEFVAFRDSVKFFQHFFRDFQGVCLRNPRRSGACSGVVLPRRRSRNCLRARMRKRG